MRIQIRALHEHLRPNLHFIIFIILGTKLQSPSSTVDLHVV